MVATEKLAVQGDKFQVAGGWKSG